VLVIYKNVVGKLFHFWQVKAVDLENQSQMKNWENNDKNVDQVIGEGFLLHVVKGSCMVIVFLEDLDSDNNKNVDDDADKYWGGHDVIASHHL